MSDNDDGRVGGIELSLPRVALIAAFTALGWTNGLEVIVQALITFKRYRTLYFWSIIISSFGALLHGVGSVLKLFDVVKAQLAPALVLYFGWFFMVVGHSVVLYSRLHLIVSDRRLLTVVKYLILCGPVLAGLVELVISIGVSTYTAP